MGGSCSKHGKMINHTLSLKPEEKRSLGRPRKDNIKVDLRELRSASVDWIHVDQYRD
jgi:hypothetical protein